MSEGEGSAEENWNKTSLMGRRDRCLWEGNKQEGVLSLKKFIKKLFDCVKVVYSIVRLVHSFVNIFYC